MSRKLKTSQKKQKFLRGKKCNYASYFSQQCNTVYNIYNTYILNNDDDDINLSNALTVSVGCGKGQWQYKEWWCRSATVSSSIVRNQ